MTSGKLAAIAAVVWLSALVYCGSADWLAPWGVFIPIAGLIGYIPLVNWAESKWVRP